MHCTAQAICSSARGAFRKIGNLRKPNKATLKERYLRQLQLQLSAFVRCFLENLCCRFKNQWIWGVAVVAVSESDTKVIHLAAALVAAFYKVTPKCHQICYLRNPQKRIKFEIVLQKLANLPLLLDWFQLSHTTWGQVTSQEVPAVPAPLLRDWP